MILQAEDAGAHEPDRVESPASIAFADLLFKAKTRLVLELHTEKLAAIDIQ
jgi:hypothetical protein